MKKPNTIIEGKNIMVGNILTNRLLPANSISGVGPFLLLAHGYPIIYQQGDQFMPAMNEHPHRGIISFTFVIEGELEHMDSLGNRAFANEGGAHWLSAGKGVLHGERASARFVESGGTIHTIQFWINLPSAHKADSPQYRTLNAGDFPIARLPEHAGELRVLLGNCGSIESNVQSLSQEFLYRVTLYAKSEFRIAARQDIKSAVFVPDLTVVVNGEPIGKSQLLVLENNEDGIVLRNPGISNVDAFVLGGPEPAEPVVVQGPFAMNSQKEISDAYQDFFAGKYGFMPKAEMV
jgi:redox-sensitive bicupin YhaK (pirin superfamily)